MKILFCTTSTNNTDTVMSSLASLGQHTIQAFQYDAKWNIECQQAVTANPSIRPLLQAGMWPAPQDREAFKPRVRMDEMMVEVAKTFAPDVIFYISAWEGLFVPDDETLKTLNNIAPLVHLCFDASDPPWWPQMKRFEEAKLFSLTVNIDGGHVWPGGRHWTADHPLCPPINGLTVLTPIDPRYFTPVNPTLWRPFPVAYAGNHGGWLRNQIFDRMQSAGFKWRERDDNFGSYGHYAQYLMQCRAIVNVPFTGSTVTTHVKGRVVEAAHAGTALLEWKNDSTRAWFAPREMFWEYEGVEDCIEQCHFLDAKPRLCEEMAQALRFEVTTKHSAEKIWNKIFLHLPQLATRETSEAAD